jgi:hypothetical protein
VVALTAGVAVAVAPSPSRPQTIGDYLRAALESLEAQQVVLQAELITAVAANDQPLIDATQNQASVCSIAIAEVERAIEFDDIRGPYVPAGVAGAAATSSPPAVTA